MYVLRGFPTSGTTQTDEKTAKKGRSQYDKVGKYQYLLRKSDAMLKELKEIKTFMRFLAKGLETQMVFEPEYIEDLAVADEIDREILDLLRAAGEYGMLPSNVAAKLGHPRYNRFMVSARLKRMNKRLDKVLGKKVAEKRGHNWALTSFMRQNWGNTKEEVTTSTPEQEEESEQ
jgi:hypothetical protein